MLRQMGTRMADRGQSTAKQPATARQRCSAMRRDGQPCRAPAVHFLDDSAELGGSAAYCISHSPLRDPELARADRQRGGRNRSNVARLLKAAPDDSRTLLATLYQAVAETRSGELPASNARAIAALAGAAVQVLEAVELQAKLAELDARLSPPARPWSPPSRREVA